MHETRIWEVPGSNLVADRLGWGFQWFPQSKNSSGISYFQKQMSGWSPYSTTNDIIECFSGPEAIVVKMVNYFWSGPTDGSEILTPTVAHSQTEIDDSRDKTSVNETINNQ